MKVLKYFLLIYSIFAVNSTFLYAQFAGGDGSQGNPYKIATVDQLQNLKDYLDKHFILINDIDATVTSSWNNGQGFIPIGYNANSPFTGSLNGNNHIINYLTINLDVIIPPSDGIGLFYDNHGHLFNIGLENVNIYGTQHAGSLAGYNSNPGVITNCYTTGYVTAADYAGGLVASNTGLISRCSTNAVTKAFRHPIGGLVGQNNGIIEFSCAEGNTSNDDNSKKSKEFFAKQNLNPRDVGINVGGLVGENIPLLNQGIIKNCYSTGFVYSNITAGGLVGQNTFGGVIQNSYSVAQVETSQSGINSPGKLGGLVADNTLGTIINSYAAGQISNLVHNSGLVFYPGTIIDSYWNKETSGQQGSGGGIGMDNVEFREQSSFGGFDFGTDWEIIQDHSFPYLKGNKQEPLPGYILPFAGGDGSAGNPYQIVTLEQVGFIRYFLSSNFILKNFIDASSTSTWNNGQGFLPLGTPDEPFTGSLNGNGFSIKKLKIDRDGRFQNTDAIGFIGTNMGEITRLGLEEVDIKGMNQGTIYTGAIAGRNRGKINRCYVTGTVVGDFSGGIAGHNTGHGTITNSYTKGFITTNFAGWSGGVVGVIDSGAINDCYSTADVGGGLCGGGFAAAVEGGSITNCYSSGPVEVILDRHSPGGDFGGFIGTLTGGTVAHSYWNITKSGFAASQGGIGLVDSLFRKKHSFAGFNFNDLWYIIEDNSYPYLRNNSQYPPPGLVPFEGGNGTVEHPYEIANIYHLQEINEYSNKHFILIDHIDASVTKHWSGGAGFKPIRTFTGTLNGNGNTVSGLTIHRAADTVALFIKVMGEINNMHLTHANIMGYEFAAALAGIVGEGGKVKNCSSSGNILLDSANKTLDWVAGGLVGMLDHGEIDNCYTAGHVLGGLGPASTGGIVGFNKGGVITNCYTTSNVFNGSSVGGITGSSSNDGLIKDCYSMGKVENAANLGGITGFNNTGAEIVNCYAAGNLSEADNIGGLVGWFVEGSISNCYWNITTTGQSSGIGSGNIPLGITGLTDRQFREPLNFIGFDFLNVWETQDDVQSYPYLRSNRQVPLPGSDGTLFPSEYVLLQNYPNPFNPATTIIFDIPHSSLVKLKVYDLLGREVAVLVNKQLSAGSYRHTFNGSALPSGVYFYLLQAGDFLEAKKMVLVK